MNSVQKLSALFFALLFGFVAQSTSVHADADTDAPEVKAAIAVDADTKPTDVFSPTTPALNAFFKSTGTSKGDKFRGVWIAEDVGAAAPANTKIDESALPADQDDYFGAFTLSKPTNGWPLGKYRVEIYLNDKLVTTVKFSIIAAK